MKYALLTAIAVAMLALVSLSTYDTLTTSGVTRQMIVETLSIAIGLFGTLGTAFTVSIAKAVKHDRHAGC